MSEVIRVVNDPNSFFLQQFLLLTQDCFLTQHVLEPTRIGNVLFLILLLLQYVVLKMN